MNEHDDEPADEHSTEADAQGSEAEAPEEVEAPEAEAPRARRWWTSLVPGLVLMVGLSCSLWAGTQLSPAAEEPSEEHDGEHGEIWTCSMHPQIRMPKPGDCPICGMELVPASGGDEGAESSDPVQLSERARAMAQIRTSPVRRIEPRREVRLLGRVDYDETRLRMITPWTGGRIDRLHVRVTGAKVRRGQLVATLYSPEIYAALRELITAAKQAKALSGGVSGSASIAAKIVEASRERLRLLGVPDSLIEQVERDAKAPKQVKVRSLYAGTVLERTVDEGDYVEPGTVLFHIVDLSKVWLQIDAYEADLSLLSLGQRVEFEVESLPDETFVGEVAFIDPVLDPQTRTARVRVEVDNGERKLRPGMFAQARIEGRESQQASHLVIPASAALFTGHRSVVYVEIADLPGTYTPREVRLGLRAGSVYPVLAGLEEGERVVSEGAFFIDADLQLHGGRSMSPSASASLEEEEPLIVSPEMLTALEPLVREYLDVHDRLAADEIDGARERLRALAEAVNEVEAVGPKPSREAWSELASSIEGHARHGAMAKDTSTVRAAYGALSEQFVVLLEHFGNPTEGEIDIAFCPMALERKGARWVQRRDSLTNPYFGAAMLGCGELRASLAPGERFEDPERSNQ